MSRCTLTVLFASSLIAGLTAQNCYYAPSNTPSTGTCNVFPWGQRSSRYQSLFTAQDLGNRVSQLKQLSFAPCGGGTFQATTITIRFAYFKGATLSTNFTQNLGTGSVVMLNKNNHSFTKNRNAWSPVGLTGTFVYIPARGNLLVDIVFQGGSGGSSFHRATRQRVYANNWTSNPPATGTSNFGALKMRVCDGQSTGGSFTNYGKGCGSGPLTISGMGTPNIGNTITIRMTRGARSTAGAFLVGAKRLAIKLDGAGMTGCVLHTDIFDTVGATFDAAGASTPINLPLPNIGALVGVAFTYSGLNLDKTANARGITTAGGLEMRVGK